MDRYLVYNTQTGRIARSIHASNEWDTESEALEDDQALLVIDPNVDTTGKLVDVDSLDLIDDPSYDPPVPVSERVSALEDATGVGGDGSRGIASRLDSLEDRIESLENA